MRLVLILIGLLAWAAPVLAVEYSLVQWKKTGQCEIVTSLPLWGNHWVVLGGYNSRAEAERAFALSRKTRACPTAKWARRMDAAPAAEKRR